MTKDCSLIYQFNTWKLQAELDLGNEIVNCATKKDSRSQYFQLRNEVFEILDKKLRNSFTTFSIWPGYGQKIRNCPEYVISGRRHFIHPCIKYSQTKPGPSQGLKIRGGGLVPPPGWDRVNWSWLPRLRRACFVV